MLDLALAQHVPMPEKSEFIQIAVRLNEPNEYGLTNPGEAEVLFIMEDQLSNHMAESLGGLYVARNTTDGQRIFYFYCNSSFDYESIVAEVMSGFPDHNYGCKAALDPDWAFYSQFLYPSRLEYQSILNRRVLDKMGQEGDPLTRAREIEHFMYFNTDGDRQGFLGMIGEDNFKIVSQRYSSERDEMAFSLVISRVERVDTSSIDEVVFYLIQLVEMFNGEYDGWGTGLMK